MCCGTPPIVKCDPLRTLRPGFADSVSLRRRTVPDEIVLEESLSGEARLRLRFRVGRHAVGVRVVVMARTGGAVVGDASSENVRVDDPFVGKVPEVRCGSLSGFPCDRLVTPDDENCGDPTHVLPTRDLPPPPEGVSGARVRPPRLAVVDEYVVISGPARVLDPATFDLNKVHVAKVVVDGFVSHHGVDEEVARAEVRAFAKAAVDAGKQRQEPDGTHILAWHGIRVRLSADGAAVLSYRTFHYERLPSEVLAGSPSRFRGRHAKGRQWRALDDTYSEELSEAEVLDLMRQGKARIAERVVSLYARRIGAGKDLDAAEGPLRAALAVAASEASTPLPPTGRGDSVLLAHDGVGWVIAMPAGVVVATFSTGGTDEVHDAGIPAVDL